MHVRIRNRTAVIEFEDNPETAGHADVMAEIIDLIDSGFKRFVFDFRCVEISFNSGISGFLVTTSKKIVESGATVTISNVSEADREILEAVGLNELGAGVSYGDCTE